MAGEEPERTGSLGKVRGFSGRGSRGARSSGPERSSMERPSSERKFNAEEASTYLTRGWRKSLDQLKGPEEERPTVYKPRNEKAWNSKGSNAVRADFLAMLEATMKAKKT